jgi:hypothetical protein
MALETVSADKYEYPGAAREFRTAAELDPENSYAWDLLSWAPGYEQPPEGAGAEKAARQSLRLEPALYLKPTITRVVPLCSSSAMRRQLPPLSTPGQTRRTPSPTWGWGKSICRK